MYNVCVNSIIKNSSYNNVLVLLIFEFQGLQIVGKMLDTCSAKFSCSAVANEKMSLSSNLDDLGKMRFYLISVLDEVKTQWYTNADTRTAKKGQNFHNKIKNFTNRLLNFANRFYVGKNVF